MHQTKLSFGHLIFNLVAMQALAAKCVIDGIKRDAIKKYQQLKLATLKLNLSCRDSLTDDAVSLPHIKNAPPK
jgi:hypothetical protein